VIYVFHVGVVVRCMVLWLSVNAINDVTDGVTNGVTDHGVIVNTSELVTDVSVTSLMM